MSKIISLKFRGILVLFIALLQLGLVSAALEIVEPNATLEVDYSDFSNEDQLYLHEPFTFTLRNSDSESAIVRFSFEGLPSSYNATPIADVNLSAGEERSITSNIDVSHLRPAGRSFIGYLILKNSTDVEIDRLELSQNTKSQLIFDRIKVEYIDVDGNRKSDTFRSSDNSRRLGNSVRPGSELTFTITAKNTFDRDYDEDKSAIEDVTLEIDISDSDLFSDEPEEEIDISDLDANNKEEYSFTAIIDDSIDADTYDIDFTLEGTDGRILKHSDQLQIEVKVERQRNDIRIIKSEVPDTIEVCDKDVQFSITLRNLGTRDQKYVAFSLENPELGINYHVDDIVLEKFDDSDTFSQTTRIPITLVSGEGSYSFDLKVYYDRDKIIDQERLNFKVEKCGSSASVPSPAAPTATPVSITGSNSASTEPTANREGAAASSLATPTSNGSATTNASQNATQSTPSVIQTIEEPYSTDDFFVGGLIVAIIVVVALIVVFFILLLR